MGDGCYGENVLLVYNFGLLIYYRERKRENQKWEK